MHELAGSAEMTALFWGIALLLFQIGAQATAANIEMGIRYGFSCRDDGRKPTGLLATRLARALANMLETFPIFAAAALALAVTGKTGGLGATGAWIWLAARVAYVPIYAFGITVVRTIVWFVALGGIVMMLARLIG